MASYRLIDELPNARKRRPPFSPIGLFLLTIVFLPASVPFWMVNWARLGQPEKRWMALIAALAAFVLPIAVFTLAHVDPKTAKPFTTLAKFAFAYFQLYAQRPLYDAHLARGGPKAPAGPVWAAALVCIIVPLAVMIAIQK